METLLTKPQAARSSLPESDFKVAGALVAKMKLFQIWLVDHHDANRQLLANLLNLEPNTRCERHFTSAETMLAALGSEPAPDAIMLDAHLPGRSGLEAIPVIEKLSPGTAVLIATDFFNTRLRKQVLAAGAAGYLLKRNCPAGIVEAIQTVQTIPGR